MEFLSPEAIDFFPCVSRFQTPHCGWKSGQKWRPQTPETQLERDCSVNAHERG
jgi:hypothetical protein